MSWFLKLYLFIFCSSLLNCTNAQKITVDSLLGDWKGTSLCQVKPSPCHDEIVVYHITKGSTSDSCIINADKIVNGVAEEMGTLHFKYDAEKQELTSTDYNSLWTFKVKDRKMDGTLIVKKQLYRIIEITKVVNGQ